MRVQHHPVGQQGLGGAEEDTGVGDPLGAVGVQGDRPAVVVRGVGGGGQLGAGVLGLVRPPPGCGHPAGGHHLDQVDVVLDVPGDRARDGGRVVGLATQVPAGPLDAGDRWARGQDLRQRVTGVVGLVAEVDGGVVAVAQVTDGW